MIKLCIWLIKCTKFITTNNYTYVISNNYIYVNLTRVSKLWYQHSTVWFVLHCVYQYVSLLFKFTLFFQTNMHWLLSCNVIISVIVYLFQACIYVYMFLPLSLHLLLHLNMPTFIAFFLIICPFNCCLFYCSLI